MAVLLLFGALAFLPFADRRSIGVIIGRQLTRWLGLVLFRLGMGLVFWSGLALGKLYSPEVTIQKNHQLITGGLYQYVRHPRYLGAQLLAVGLSFVFRSWIGLVANKRLRSHDAQRVWTGVGGILPTLISPDSFSVVAAAEHIASLCEKSPKRLSVGGKRKKGMKNSGCSRNLEPRVLEVGRWPVEEEKIRLFAHALTAANPSSWAIYMCLF